MRVVLDTNVLLSALFTRGVCEALLDRLIENPSAVIVSSDYILAEFIEHAIGKFGVSSRDAQAAAGVIRRLSEVVVPSKVSVGACDDRDDLPVLGTMIAGRATALVTGDKQLLALGEFEAIPILSPRALYECMA